MRPLRREIDPGWLFVVAGLALCAVGLLVPAQRDLRTMRRQVTLLAQEWDRQARELEAHEIFLEQIQDREPDVIRRLAAAQLNLVPAGETPVLLASSRDAPVSEWISRTVSTGGSTPVDPTDTTTNISWLAQVTQGGGRLWILGAGIFAVFLGLLVDGGPTRTQRARKLVPCWRRDQFRLRGDDHRLENVAYPELDDFRSYESYDE